MLSHKCRSINEGEKWVIELFESLENLHSDSSAHFDKLLNIDASKVFGTSSLHGYASMRCRFDGIEYVYVTDPI